MAESLLTTPPPPPPPPRPPTTNPDHVNFSTEFDYLPIPPLDPQFFSENNNSATEPFISDLGLEFGFEDDGDFTLTFDDLDDLYLPSETEDFFTSDGFNPSYPFQNLGDLNDNVTGGLNSSSPESGCSEVLGNGSSEVAMFLNSPSPESGSYERKYVPPVSSENSGDRNSNVTRVLNIQSWESGGSDQEFCGPVASQRSGNSHSLESRNCDPDESSNTVVDQKVKVEDIRKSSVSKRKKEHDDANTDSRMNKYRKASMSTDNANPQYSFNAADEDDPKKKARLMRNRESAQLSRQRKKHYVEELEDKLRTMHSTIADLNGKISLVIAENASLRQQLSSSGMCPQPPPGMYPHPPMAPMAYPWVPYPPYVIKSQGSQVPLVPIPRLKPQQPVSASKAKKSETKKTDGKSKKVAGVSFLGLLFFIFVFGGLVPTMHVKYGAIRNQVSGGSAYVGERFYDEHRGRILTVNGHLNGSDQSMGIGFPDGKSDLGNKLHCERGHTVEEQGSYPGSDGVVNASEPLVASLYVPRNDKLVKIDGNLIIHSILASERAMASPAAPEAKNSRETGLAIPRDLTPALTSTEVGRNRERQPHLIRNPTQQQKALTSGSADAMKDHFKATSADGRLKQWFREGLAGPMLSSGMCNEVFQFDVLPTSAPGVIVPAPSVTNSSAKHPQNATRLIKGRQRRILRSLPVPIPHSNLNITDDHVERNASKDGFQGNKSASSMVVSVLVDPREAGNIDGDGMVTPKALSRIFVVVLLDRVKYVTYSCMLPPSGLHLVTT